jgi:hypothetical protein
MNICTIFNTNQNQSWVESWGEIWPNFHIHMFATRFILSLLKVNEEGFTSSLRVEVTTLKVRE